MAMGSHSSSDSVSYPLAVGKVLPEAKDASGCKIFCFSMTLPEAYGHPQALVKFLSSNLKQHTKTNLNKILNTKIQS